MDILAWCLGGVVLVYTVIYSYKILTWILDYQKQKRNGELIEFNGVVASKTDEINKFIDGEKVNISYPVYKGTINEKEILSQSAIKYRNVTIGQSVLLSYSERNKKLWAIQDIPKMKSLLLLRLILMVTILTILVLESMYL